MHTSPQIRLHGLPAAEKPLTPAFAATLQHVPRLGSATFRATFLVSGRPMLENGAQEKPVVLQAAVQNRPTAALQKLAACSLQILPQKELANHSDTQSIPASQPCELLRIQSPQTDRPTKHFEKHTAATVKKAVASPAESATGNSGLFALQTSPQPSAHNPQPIEISCAFPLGAACIPTVYSQLTIADPGSDTARQHSQTTSLTPGSKSQFPQTAPGINGSQPPHTELPEPPRHTADSPGKAFNNSPPGDTKVPAPSLGETKVPKSILQTVRAHEAPDRQGLATITSAVQTTPIAPVPPTALLPMQGKVIAHQQVASAVPAPSTFEANHVSAGSARIEVGVQDSTHGWLKVRAEVGSAGVINTSLIVLSPAHDALHESLPEIANYLHSEGIAVAKIDLHRAPAGSDGSEAQPAQTGTAANNGEGERSKDSSSTSGARTHSQSRAGSGDASAIVPSAALWTSGVTRTVSSFNPPLMMSSGLTGGWVNLCA